MTDASKKPTVVECPTCQKSVEWTAESKWKPFCSERCKLIDLGEWASESYNIAGEQVMPETLEQSSHEDNKY